MAVHKFVFCDICNPQHIRSLEFRRTSDRGDRAGRRITDARAWYDGELSDAVEQHGWEITSDGQHLCPNCKTKAQS